MVVVVVVVDDVTVVHDIGGVDWWADATFGDGDREIDPSSISKKTATTIAATARLSCSILLDMRLYDERL